MRVIAGRARGRRLRTLPGLALRPTADKVKGAVFSMLLSRFALENTVLLDLFAGSGALGIEALSRGARHVTFIEQAAPAAAVLRANLAACGFAAEARVVCDPVERALRRLGTDGARFDGVLLDPPYGHGHAARTLATLGQSGLLTRGAWVVAEHAHDEPLEPRYGMLRLTHARRYGKTGVALFVVDEAMGQSASSGRQAARAVYAGSFDPITNGHLDVVRRAMAVFDQVIVAVAGSTSDPKKDRALFTAVERIDMIREALGDTGDHVVVDSFSGLLVDYCDTVGATVIIRGLRAVSDFEYEFQMAMMNRHLKPHIETFFMTASQNYFYTASRLVKEVAALGGDVGGLLPETVLRRLHAKFGRTA